MVQVALETRLRLVAACLPGLVHFDFQPLTVPIDRPVRRLRVYLPLDDRLILRGMELQSPKDDPSAAVDMDGATYAMSSQAEGTSPPELALKGRGIGTKGEALPWWEVRWRRPQKPTALLLTNRRGTPASRNAAIRVDMEDAAGHVWTFDNAGDEALLERTASYEAAVEHLCTGRWHKASSRPLGDDLSALHASLTALATTLRDGLAGGEWKEAAMEAARLSAIRQTTDFVAALDPSIKREGLTRAAAVLETLIQRAAVRGAANGSDEEALAVAMILASVFVKKRRVTNKQLRENQRFMSTPERADFIDRFVSDTYVELTGDESLLPIMIRSHGLTGAHLLKNSDEYLDSIEEVAKLFADRGYKLAICYGTFLGAVREKAFIPHDDDIDTVLLLRATDKEGALKEMAELSAEMREQGITINLNSNSFMKIKAPNAGRRMDVFPVIENGPDTVLMVMEKLRLRDVPRSAILPFGTIEFYGRTFACPATDAEFLEQRYGSTWNVPLRQVGGRTVEASDDTGSDGDDD